MAYDPRWLAAIPRAVLERDYGCGDPSRHVLPGETVLDLGTRERAVAVMDGLQVQWLLDPAAVDMPRTVRAMIDALLAGWGRPPLSGVP